MGGVEIARKSIAKGGLGDVGRRLIIISERLSGAEFKGGDVLRGALAMTTSEDADNHSNKDSDRKTTKDDANNDTAAAGLVTAGSPVPIRVSTRALIRVESATIRSRDATIQRVAPAAIRLNNAARAAIRSTG